MNFIQTTKNPKNTENPVSNTGQAPGLFNPYVPLRPSADTLCTGVHRHHGGEQGAEKGKRTARYGCPARAAEGARQPVRAGQTSGASPASGAETRPHPAGDTRAVQQERTPTGAEPKQSAVPVTHLGLKKPDSSKDFSLKSSPDGIIPYIGYDRMAGRMSGMLPGLFENGGVYCHASAFKILADCKTGRADAALRTLKKIMPDSEWNPSSQSGAEPYVFTNCYATHPKYYGRSYQSWTTGTSAWCLRGLVEGILGIQADYEGLRIRPCLPSDWDQAEATRRFRGADYHILIRRGAEKVITADGNEVKDNLLPDFRDGRVHEIVVTV